MPNNRPLSAELFFPTTETIAQARLQDWDALAKRAADDPEGFWAQEAEELEWY